MKWLFIVLIATLPPFGAAIAGADPWLEQAKLVAADGANSDEFGYSVALEGDTAVVGARIATVDGKSEQGAVYVLVRDGETWTEQDKLIASDGTSSDSFGVSVAISGDTVLVGARDKNGGQGAAYVYVRVGESWAEQVKLVASDGGADHQFGMSVALFGDTALVGAERAEVDGHNLGAVYVFTRDGGGVWSEEDKLVGDWPFGSCSFATCPRFGHSVALWEDTALVGAVNMFLDGSYAGEAYVFVREAGEWTRQAMLGRPVVADDERFGESVALWGDTALIGASGVTIDGNAGQGVVHAFTRDGSTWSEQQEFTALDGEADDAFGTSLALLDGIALIGAVGSVGTQGAAYRYTRDGQTWTEQQKLEPSDGAVGDSFGTSAALSGDTALLGAPQAEIDGNSDQGAVYVFVAQEASNPDLIFAPTGLDFGVVEVGTTSAPQTATLSNTGDSDATGLTFNTPGSGFDVDSSACGADLPAGGDCEVSVTFTPAAAGPAGATLTTDSDQGASADLALAGEGDGTGPPQLSFSPDGLDFGDVEVSTTSAPQTATLSNTGDSDATGLSFNTPGGGFDVDSSACGASLLAGDDCEVSVTFTPVELGQANDTLTVDGDEDVSASLDLTGNGTSEPGILLVHPEELDFGAVEVGDTAVMTATVANVADPGEGSLTLDALELDDGGMLDPSTSLVSLTPEGNQWGGRTLFADITPDGRYVLFPGRLRGNTTAHLYRHDLWTGTVDLASANAEGDAVRISLNGDVDNFDISSDGRYVAFKWGGSGIGTPPIPDATGGNYIRDMDAGVTEFIDIPTTDGELPNGSNPPSFLSFSADFRIIAFVSSATNLVPGECSVAIVDVDACIYIFDRDANTVERVDVAYDGTPQDFGSLIPIITPDGRYVAFFSGSTNLVPDDTNGEWDVFVHDRETGITERVSVASDGSEANDGAAFGSGGDRAVISADGRYVAFASYASNLVPDDTNGFTDIFVRDRVAGTTERVSVASDGSQADQSSTAPAITPDGRYVVFKSNASNLVPGDTNEVGDHFIHDRATGITERVSVATDGTEGNERSIPNRPGISADGRFVTFASDATNLAPLDTNSQIDIFMRDRGGPALGTAFEITGGDCAVGTVLEPGDTCTVEIAFTPPLEGADFEGALNVATGDEQSASVMLHGTAPEGPVLTFNPPSLDFGDVPVGTTSTPQNASLTNMGDSDATGLDFTASGGGDYFDTDTTDCGNTLSVGESCQVVITFTPPGKGLTFAALTAESNEEASARLNLAGKGTPGGGGLEIIFEDNFQQDDKP